MTELNLFKHVYHNKVFLLGSILLAGASCSELGTFHTLCMYGLIPSYYIYNSKADLG